LSICISRESSLSFDQHFQIFLDILTKFGKITRMGLSKILPVVHKLTAIRVKEGFFSETV
jgi:hypothetical protein